MSHDLTSKPHPVPDSSLLNKEELPDLAPEVDAADTASPQATHAQSAPPALPIQRTLGNRASQRLMGQASVLQLQRTLGNQTTTRLMAQQQMGQMKADVDTIQRWPAWLDKLVGRGAYKKLEEAPAAQEDGADDRAQMSQLEKIKEKLQPWADMYAIHTNYKKYAELLGKKAWKMAMKVWEYVNKVLGVVSNLDPTGISKAVAEVSKLIKLLAGYVTEAYDLMTDPTLVEQLTPLLGGDIFAAVKGSIQDIKGIWDAGSAAWDAVSTLA
ncbi:MAG: hypothetical protein MUF38_01165 [Anaerolineae bacterium]|jgi:hypothetical protein|nr:hypothetical protein [Anaerolineae bacterium]